MARSIQVTQINLATTTPGIPCERHKVVIPVSRIDEVHEATVGDYVDGQFNPVAVNCSLIVKVNGERMYVEEKPDAIQALMEVAS